MQINPQTVAVLFFSFQFAQVRDSFVVYKAIFRTVGESPDMMSVLEGERGYGKADIVR